MPEADTLLALFGDEDDFDLGALGELVQQGTPPSDADIEALMREQWGLPALDTTGALKAAEAGRVSVRPDDSDQDDYSEEEWIIVRTMRKLCIEAISPATPAKRRARAVQWLFVRGTEETRHGVSFHLACDMLRSRHWVIQALIQHFWFLRGITPGALPFLADPLPDSLQSEAILHGWEPGLRIAMQTWAHPGIPDAELRRSVDAEPDEYDRSMLALAAAGVIGTRLGSLYLTSRPATFRRARQAVSWSNSFLGE